MVSEFSLDLPQTGLLPEPDQAVLLRQRVGKQAITGLSGLRIDRRRRIPEQALKNETAAKVPDCRGDHPAGARDAAHLQHRPRGVGHEVERQLRDRPGKPTGGERQVQRIRLLELDAGAALSPSREGEVRRRDVHRRYASVGEAAPQLERDAARAAADVEHRAVARQFGEVDQSLREPASPATKEALVRGAVVGEVGGGRAQARAQSIATMTSEALMTAEASWPDFSLRSSTA